MQGQSTYRPPLLTSIDSKTDLIINLDIFDCPTIRVYTGGVHEFVFLVKVS